MPRTVFVEFDRPFSAKERTNEKNLIEYLFFSSEHAHLLWRLKKDRERKKEREREREGDNKWKRERNIERDELWISSCEVHCQRLTKLNRWS